METRRQSFCDKFNNYLYSGYNYIKYKIIVPINHNKSWSLQAAAYVAASSYVATTTGLSVYEQTENLAYTIARASGAALRYDVPSVVLPTLLASASLLQRSGIGPYLGLNNRVLTHKLIAGVIAGLGVTHAVGHFFYNKDNFLKQPGFTGYVMLGCFVGPLAGVYLIHKLKPKSQLSYHLRVELPHELGADIFTLAFILHTADFRLIPYGVAMFAVRLLDKFYEYFSYQHKTKLQNVIAIKNTDYLLVGFDRPPHMSLDSYLPGQYVKVSLSNPIINPAVETPPPPINRFQEGCHPFTIIDLQKDTIFLAIKKNGWWTTQLEQFANKKNINHPATLWGPYGSPLNSFYKKSQLAVITGGIGMTPFLAYIFWLVQKHQTSPILSLDISLAKIEEAFLLIKALNHPNIKRIKFIERVNIYITQQKISEIQSELANIEHHKHLNFVFPEQKQMKEKKEETLITIEEEQKAFLIDQIDDDFFVSFDDPSLLKQLPPSLKTDQPTDLAIPDEKYKTQHRPSPFMSGTPANVYPALNATGFFPSAKEHRKSLDISIYTRRMNVDQIFAGTFFKKAAVCGGDRLMDSVAEAAVSHGIKLYKESF